MISKCFHKDSKRLHDHKICSICFKSYYGTCKDWSHCPIAKCNSDLFFFEIRKILDAKDCEDFQNQLSKDQSVKAPRPEWICKSCTFVNLPGFQFCNACRSNRPHRFLCPKYYKLTEPEEKAEEEERLIANIKVKDIPSKPTKLAQTKLQKEQTKEEETQPIPNIITRQESSTCQKCHLSFTGSDGIVLHSCHHPMCRKCFRSLVLERNTKYQCPACQSQLFDFEIRKMLNDADYKKLELQLSVNQYKPKVAWICELCSYINLPVIKFCHLCQENQPETFKCPSYYVKTKEEEDVIKEELRLGQIEVERQKMDEEKKVESLKTLMELTKQEVAMTQEVSECPVCMLEYEAGDAIILHSCLHTICRDCFTNYLINTQNPKIKCPTENCIGQIEDKEIQKMLSDTDYRNYEQLSLRTAEATEALSFHCKATDCSAWIVHDEDVINFRCPLCKKVNCIKCETIHDGETCEEFKAKTSKQAPTADEIYFENMLKNGEAMLCSGCKCLVEKDKGCDWIRCKLCQTELCWATKGPRWGPKGHGDTSGGCQCRMKENMKCHPSCRYCH